jgi:hypothetical protein
MILSIGDLFQPLYPIYLFSYPLIDWLMDGWITFKQTLSSSGSLGVNEVPLKGECHQSLLPNRSASAFTVSSKKWSEFGRKNKTKNSKLPHIGKIIAKFFQQWMMTQKNESTPTIDCTLCSRYKAATSYYHRIIIRYMLSLSFITRYYHHTQYFVAGWGWGYILIWLLFPPLYFFLQLRSTMDKTKNYCSRKVTSSTII